MITLNRNTRPVNRTFGEGLVEPEPATLPWEPSIRKFLAEMSYGLGDRDAACSWIRSRGNVTGCPVVSPEDWTVVNAQVVLAGKGWLSGIRADRKPEPDVEPEPEPAPEPTPVVEPEPAAGWPAWVDDYTWELNEPTAVVHTDADSVWHSQRLDERDRWAHGVRFSDDLSPGHVDDMCFIGAAG